MSLANDNHDEVEKLLTEALDEAKAAYDIDKILSAIWSVDVLLREDRGEMIERPHRQLWDSNIPEST